MASATVETGPRARIVTRVEVETDETITLVLDRNEAEAILHALDRQYADRPSQYRPPPYTSLTASAIRVSAALRPDHREAKQAWLDRGASR